MYIAACTYLVPIFVISSIYQRPSNHLPAYNTATLHTHLTLTANKGIGAWTTGSQVAGGDGNTRSTKPLWPADGPLRQTDWRNPEICGASGWMRAFSPDKARFISMLICVWLSIENDGLQGT